MSEDNFSAFDEEDFDSLIYLSDEDGNELAFEFLDSVEYEGDEYVVLVSTDEDDDEVVILKVEHDPEDGDEVKSLFGVEDEAVASAVFEIFKENNRDFYDFAD